MDSFLERLPRTHNLPQVDKVLLLREIGRGAMGVVHAGWHTHLEIPVAVKFLLHAEDAVEERILRFKREARLCAELDEPNLLRVLDIGVIDKDVHYLIMEWVPGKGLDRVVDTAGPLSEPEVITVLRDVGQALISLHRKKIIHRDLKPANLLLRARDGRIKIADLGIAKESGNVDATQTQSILGTPAYISPEQVRAPHRVAGPSDLFSLGATAFTLLTGQLPFTGQTVYETLTNICTLPLPHPNSFGANISDATWNVLQHLTAKSLADRFPNAEALLERLPPVSMPFRPEVLQAAAPDLEIRRPESGTTLPILTVPAEPIAARRGLESTVDLCRPIPDVAPSYLLCQCLQNDFIAPIDHESRLPNKLHIGWQEVRRLVGADPPRGPLVRAVSACARAEHLRMIYIRDWHDSNDPLQRAELEFFGPHCLIGTWGARFLDVLEAFSRDRQRAAVIDAGGLNDFEDTPILDLLQRQIAPEERTTVPVGVIGVWTNAKVLYLLYDLKTRAKLQNLATCSRLVASPNHEEHLNTLRHLEEVLNVKVFHEIEPFLQFLGVDPATLPEVEALEVVAP